MEPHREGTPREPGTPCCQPRHGRAGRVAAWQFRGAAMSMMQSTFAELVRIEAELIKAGIAASREPYVIELFEADPPTGWTMRHQRVDALLDEWELARG